jgi:nicotinamidase-related amidase
MGACGFLGQSHVSVREDLKAVQEHDRMRSTDHPNVVQLVESFQGDERTSSTGLAACPGAGLSQTISADKTLVLICDYQPDIFGICQVPNEGKDLVAKANKVSEAARANASCAVAFVRVALREGYPEVHPNNTLFSIVKSYGKLVDGTTGAALHTELKVENGDRVFTKRRVSAFSTTDLAYYCRVQGFTSLVIGGVSTSGVVLTTTREAWDMDLKITVLQDLCADEPDKHDALCNVIYPGMGSVTTADEWVAGLK